MPGATGCMEWLAARDPSGYGRFSVATSRARLAHRVAYVLAEGEDPGVGVLRHTCDNPPCCNPNHLLLGTHADNMADKVAKGRHTWPVRSGSANPRAKLSDTDVWRIVAALDAGASVPDLALAYSVSRSTIETIKYGTRRPTAALIARGVG